jgi:hypothetical protein
MAAILLAGVVLLISSYDITKIIGGCTGGK